MRLLILLAILFSQPAPAKPAPPLFKQLPTAIDAQVLALADLRRNVPAFDRPYTHYIWNQANDPLCFKVISWVLNILSRASVIVRPEPIANGILIRFNLRNYAPRTGDLAEWAEAWEEFQFDPAFSRLLTKGTLASAGLQVKGRGFVSARKQVFVETPPYEHNGAMVHGRWESQRVAGVQDFDLKDLKDIDLIRVPSTDLAVYGALVELTGSQAPVVSDAYFLARGLSAIREAGVWETIYGGLYYRFVGIKKGEKGQTDEDRLFEEHLGIGGKGVNAAAFYERLRSDQRAAIFGSKIRAESPRRADFFRAPGGARLDHGSGIVVITHDLKNKNADVDNHPIMNLLELKDDARELIYERPNGLHGYALFNGQGVRQDEVPPDVANDATIPKPFNQRLQPAISCISCHEADGSDGWKPMSNDVAKLTGYLKAHGRQRLNIFGDTSRLNDLNLDTLDRLAGLYQGEPEPALARGRNDYAAAVLRATGPWPASTKGQADVVKLAAEALVKRWHGYWYQSIGAAQALREMGMEVDPAKAVETLEALLPPDIRSAAFILGYGPAIPEDPRIAALKAGILIPRVDFDLTRSFMEDRIRFNLKRKK